MEAATLIKPKKYEVVEYPVQKVDNLEEKRRDSQAVFETLSVEDQEKYHEAYAEFVQKAKALGFDQVEEYDVLFDLLEKHADTAAGFLLNTNTGENRIVFNPESIAESSVLEIKKNLFHEIIGHAIGSKNITKKSNKLKINTLGLEFSNIKDKVSKIDISLPTKIIKYFKSRKKNLEFPEDEIQLVLKYGQQNNIEGLMNICNKLISSLQSNDTVDVFTGRSKEIVGLELNEAVTEFLAIYMAKNNPTEKMLLIISSPYIDLIRKIYALDNKLVSMDEKYGTEFDNCLLDARLTGQPYKIIKFLKDKTDISITPKELFALDFSKILGIKEENKLDIAN